MPGVRDPALLKALAAEIKARRANLKITQEELAHRSGLGAVFIARVEIAQNQPSLSAFVRLADGLNANPSDLIASVLARYRDGGLPGSGPYSVSNKA
jgi:transcriptional regulator with XRE-family HTH domain